MSHGSGGAKSRSRRVVTPRMPKGKPMVDSKVTTTDRLPRKKR